MLWVFFVLLVLVVCVFVEDLVQIVECDVGMESVFVCLVGGVMQMQLVQLVEWEILFDVVDVQCNVDGLVDVCKVMLELVVFWCIGDGGVEICKVDFVVGQGVGMVLVKVMLQQ